MREIDIVEAKKIMVEELVDIREVCEKNNLKYFLAYGTLLGAVRHKGFIPWDDDVDICMPRPDYNKFIKIYNAESGKNNLLATELDSKYRYNYAKLAAKNTVLIEHGGDAGVKMGVYIDIFPIDGLGDTKEQARKIRRRVLPYIILNLGLLVNKNRDYVSFIKNCEVFVCYCLAKMVGGRKFLAKKISQIMSTYSYDDSKYVGVYIDDNISDREIMAKDIFASSVDMEFENEKFAVPVEYDCFLKHCYGDYMKLPPKEEQVLAHGYKAYVEDDK